MKMSVIFSKYKDETGNSTRATILDFHTIVSVTQGNNDSCYVNTPDRSVIVPQKDLTLVDEVLRYIREQMYSNQTIMWDEAAEAVVSTIKPHFSSDKFRNLVYLASYGELTDLTAHLVRLVDPPQEQEGLVASALDALVHSLGCDFRGTHVEWQKGAAGTLLSALADRAAYVAVLDPTWQAKMNKYDFASPYNGIFIKLTDELKLIAGDHWPSKF